MNLATQIIEPPNGFIRITCHTCRGTKVNTSSHGQYPVDIMDECNNQVAPDVTPCGDCNGKGEYKVKKL